MATLEQLPSGSWRVQIRRVGYQRLTQTFLTKEEAEEWAHKTEASLLTQRLKHKPRVARTDQHQSQKPVEPPEETHAVQAQRQRLESVLCNDRKSPGTSNLKELLLKFGYFQEVCAECKLEPIWNGRPLSLHLDHINGNSEDNRLRNLRLLCPNCHSQTPTYAGRNKKRSAKLDKPTVSTKTLEEALRSAASIREALMLVGLRGAGANYQRAMRVLKTLKQAGLAPSWFEG